MPRSHWKLHVDTSKGNVAKKIVNKCIKAIGRPPIEIDILQYSKGGYMAKLQFHHDDKLLWSEILFEIISFGQTLGVGWHLLGQIEQDPSAVLNKESGSRIFISGLLWAEWSILNEQKVNN